MSYGEIRIIGGVWRGRKLPVSEVMHLRPTPNRVRETLFNWLIPVIKNARCLDLFAGSGVLGFEALSRGAVETVFVEMDSIAIDALQKTCNKLQIDTRCVIKAKIPEELSRLHGVFNVIFLDPPYEQELIAMTAMQIEHWSLAAENALIYLEANRVIHDNELPSNWRIIKQNKAGQVFYHLARRL